MLRKDLSDLPAASKPTGLAPDEDDTFVRLVVDELAKQPPKPKAGDTLSRHSAAGSCMMQVALLRDGVEPEPMDMAGLHITNLGTLSHEAWQDALYQVLGGNVDLEAPSTIEDLTSGSCDALIESGGCGRCRWALNNDDALPCECDPKAERHVLELKTTGGFGYKKMIGATGTAEGPKSGHMVQLALNVMGHDADRGTLVYLANEAVSKGMAEKKGIGEALRFGAQWSFTREQLQPLADEWLEQLRWVRDHETDEVPRFWPHSMPKGARIVDPNTARWELRDGDDVLDTGQVWGGQGCSYCPVQKACVERWADGK